MIAIKADDLVHNIVALIPCVGPLVVRARDREASETENRRIYKLLYSLADDLVGMKRQLEHLNQQEGFGDFMHDMIAQVKQTHGSGLINAHRNLLINTISTERVDEGFFALKLLEGFTEHHMRVLKYMSVTDYDNAHSVKVATSSKKKIERMNIYKDNPVFSFLSVSPRLKSHDDRYVVAFVIDATELDFQSEILLKISNDLKVMGLADAPEYHTFSDDRNQTGYLCLGDIGKWLVNITEVS